MNVYLSDPIIRTLIDLPCIYAAKDGYDIVTDDDVEGDRQYASREERLQAIQKAVQAGDYDSDEILEVAVARMLRRGAFEDE